MNISFSSFWLLLLFFFHNVVLSNDEYRLSWNEIELVSSHENEMVVGNSSLKMEDLREAL
jgi:hypothetical protein